MQLHFFQIHLQNLRSSTIFNKCTSRGKNTETELPTSMHKRVRSVFSSREAQNNILSQPKFQMTQNIGKRDCILFLKFASRVIRVYRFVLGKYFGAFPIDWNSSEVRLEKWTEKSKIKDQLLLKILQPIGLVVYDIGFSSYCLLAAKSDVFSRVMSFMCAASSVGSISVLSKLLEDPINVLPSANGKFNKQMELIEGSLDG